MASLLDIGKNLKNRVNPIVKNLLDNTDIDNPRAWGANLRTGAQNIAFRAKNPYNPLASAKAFAREIPILQRKTTNPIANFSLNTAKPFFSGIADQGSAINNMRRGNVLQGAAQSIVGIGKTVAPFTPFYQGANVLASGPKPQSQMLSPQPQKMPAQPDYLRRIGAGLMRGIGQDQDIATNVERQNTLKLPIVGAIDPIDTIGQTIGFVKNPINSKLFQATEKILPATLYAQPLKKWLTITASRGGLEGLLLGLSRIPENATPGEKLTFLTKEIGKDAVMEILGRGVFDTVGKGVEFGSDSKAVNDAIARLQQGAKHLNTPVNTMKLNPKTGVRITEPLWQYQLKKMGFGLSTKDINELSPEDYAKVKGDMGEIKPQATTNPLITNQPQSPKLAANQKIFPNTDAGQPGELQTPKAGQLDQSQGGGTQPPKPPQSVSSSAPNVADPSAAINGFKGKINKLYTQAIDRFHPLSVIAKQGGNEKAMQNALTGHYGSGSTANYHIDYELAPILRGQNVDNLRRAAIAMRDVELEGRGIKGSKQQKQALDNLKALEQELGPEQMKAMGESLQKLYAYQDKMVQEYLVKNGIIAKSAYDAMRKNNQFYIPYRRVMDTVDEFLGFTPQTKGAGSVSSQNVIKGIKGSSKDIYDPIESIVENTYKIVGLGKRQEVAQTIVNLKDTLPKGMVQKLPKSAKHNPAETVSLFENGKVQYYKVPQEVADAARGLSEEQMSTLIKILQAPTAVFRATATGINPEFMLPNVARDLQSAFVNAGLNPLRWVKGFAHMLKQDGLYQEFLKSGGKVSRISIDRPMLKRTVSDITSPKRFTIKKPSDLLKVLQTIGEYSEQPTRVAVFESTLNKSLKQGLPREDALKEAAYGAQEATVNFPRRGSKTQSANAIYAFVNARAQGTDRLLRSIKKDPVSASVRMGLISLAPALALRAHNSQFESYNDERLLSERDKRDNFIFMLSDTPIAALGGAQYVKIPKGDVGKLANPMEAFLDFAQGKGGDVTKVIGETLKSFLPIDEPGGLIPTAVKPIVESAVNRNFYSGYDIVPQHKKNYPDGYQDSPYTSPLFRLIGQKTNTSPAKLQHLAEGYGTGLMRIAEMGTQPFIPSQYATPENERGATINRTPIARRLIGGAKMSEEEKLKSNAGKYKAIDNEIGRIRNAAERGELPAQSAEAQIRKLQSELPSLGGSGTKQTVTDEDIDIIRLRMKTGALPSVHEEGGYVFYTRESDDSIQKIDLERIQNLPEYPTLSGNANLDKEAISRYKSELSSVTNDVYDLWKLGKLTTEEASALLDNVQGAYSKTNKPKKITIKKAKVTPFKTVKGKRIRYSQNKIPKAKITKTKGYRILTYTDNTPKTSTPKATVRWS